MTYQCIQTYYLESIWLKRCNFKQLRNSVQKYHIFGELRAFFSQFIITVTLKIHGQFFQLGIDCWLLWDKIWGKFEKMISHEFSNFASIFNQRENLCDDVLKNIPILFLSTSFLCLLTHLRTFEKQKNAVLKCDFFFVNKSESRIFFFVASRIFAYLDINWSKDTRFLITGPFFTQKRTAAHFLDA